MDFSCAHKAPTAVSSTPSDTRDNAHRSCEQEAVLNTLGRFFASTHTDANSERCSTSKLANDHARVAIDCASYPESLGTAAPATAIRKECLLRLSFEYAHTVCDRPCGVNSVSSFAAGSSTTKIFSHVNNFIINYNLRIG